MQLTLHSLYKHNLYRINTLSRRRIVVVGAGTSGAVLSMSLASRTDHELVVVESGAYSGLDDEPRFMNVLADSSLQSIHQVHLVTNSPSVPYVQAHCVGGGSAINGLLLTAQIPDVAVGMTSRADIEELGDVGRALLSSGGEPSDLWWNHGRWNPGRALMHLWEEGRIQIVSGDVVAALGDEHVTKGVNLRDQVIEADVVVMCAGAIATPKILLQSFTSSLNPDIGRGLQDHPCVTFAVELNNESRSFFDAGVIRRGTTSTGEQYLIVAYERASWSETHLGLVSVMLMTPHSRGWVSMTEGGWDVHLNMLDDARDVAAMREALWALMDIVEHDSFAVISRGVYADDEGTSIDALRLFSHDELDEWIRANLRPVSHVASSCSQAVHDSAALRAVEGMFIADASVLASVPPETPAGPVTMEARRIAREIESVLS